MARVAVKNKEKNILPRFVELFELERRDRLKNAARGKKRREKRIKENTLARFVELFELEKTDKLFSRN